MRKRSKRWVITVTSNVLRSIYAICAAFSSLAFSCTSRSSSVKRSRCWWYWRSACRRPPVQECNLLQASSVRSPRARRTTRGACSGRPWVRMIFRSACTRTAWTPSASACERGGLTGRRTLFHSARNRTVSHPCENEGDPAAATAERRTCHRRSSGTWGRAWACASTAPASIHTPAANGHSYYTLNSLHYKPVL